MEHKFNPIVKYICGISFVILIIIPLIFNCYSESKKKVIKSAQAQLNYGIQELTKAAQDTINISTTIFGNSDYSELKNARYDIAPRYYYNIYKLEKHLRDVALINSNIDDIMCIFKDNQIFVSRNISTDNFADIYGNYFVDPQKSLDEFKKMICDPNKSFFVAIPTIVNIDNYSNKKCDSLLFGALDGVVNKNNGAVITLINSKRLEQIFLDNPLLHNASIILKNPRGDTVLCLSKNKDGINEKSAVKYTKIKSTTDSTLFKAEMIIPNSTFNSIVFSSVQTILFYGFIGILMIIITAIGMYYNDLLHIKKILKIAEDEDTVTLESSSRNIYEYMILKFRNSKNKISDLNDKVINSTVVNLLLSGTYINRQDIMSDVGIEDRVRPYFVCIVKVYSSYTPLTIEYVEKIKKIMQQKFDESSINSTVIVNTNMNELATVIFNKSDISNYSINYILQSIINDSKWFNTKGVNMCTGLSTLHEGIENIHTAYLEAKNLLDMFHEEGVSRTYICDEVMPDSTDESMIDLTILNNIYSKALAGDMIAINEIFEELKKYSLVCNANNCVKQQILFSIRQPVENAAVQLRSKNIKRDIKVCYIDASESFEDNLSNLKSDVEHICSAVCDMRKEKGSNLHNSIIDYIKENYTDCNLSATLIANRFNVSEKYIFNVIKEYSSVSLSKIIDDLRIQMAERLLLTSKEAMTEIAKKCGYGSVNTFYRAFSKVHGVPPATWRKSNS